MRVDRSTAVIAVALLLGALPTCAPAQERIYGQVETFQPGKKYNCIPAANGKGWDCKEIGKADVPASDSSTDAKRRIEPVHSSPLPPAATNAAASSDTPSHATIDAAPAASALPNYLTNASATGRAQATSVPVDTVAASPGPLAKSSPEPAATPSSARASSRARANQTATKTSAARDDVETSIPPAQAAAQSASAPPAVVAATARVPSPAPAPAPSKSDAHSVIATAAPNSPPITAHSQSEFLALPGAHFVIELAHAPSQSALVASASVQVPRGHLYVLHLRQNDADLWLKVWGEFDTIQAARAARNELITEGAIAPGWPRRIAPLQAEVRRIQ